MRPHPLFLLLFLCGCASTLPPNTEGMSLLGTPLVRRELRPELLEQRTNELVIARRDYERDSNNADAIIWLGRRTAYLGRFREAIDIFSEGIRKHPDDARMFRHRGHRYLTIRQFDRAIADFERADELTRGKPDEIEPDGLPNARNTPIGSLQSNICYHHALAWYLKGDFARALPIYERCHQLSTNDDRLVSTTHWLYMTLRRLGRVDDASRLLAPIHKNLDVIENVAYHKLTLLYAGQIAPEELLHENPDTTDGVTILYGVGNWFLYNGQHEKARESFQRIVDANNWAPFGFIAAEAELARADHP